MLVQLYGATTVEDACLCADAGADHVGLVVDERLGAWDAVDLTTATAMLAALQGRARTVLCSLATNGAAVLGLARATSPDIVHLARAVQLGVSAVADVRAALPGVQVMCTIPVLGRDALAEARRYEGVADFLLLDSMDPTTSVVGASGRTHDWAVSAAVVAAVDTPVILAGGLGPDNVAAAIARVRPAGVDSETHTSRADDRRRKDPGRVRAFVRAAREHAG